MQKVCVLETSGLSDITCILLKRRGQKNVRLSVKYDGSITLSVPWWVSRVMAEQYLATKRAWIEEALARVTPSPVLGGRLGGSRESRVQEQKDHYTQHKERARILVHERLPELNAHYGFAYGRVAIRKNATSWGSCSSKCNLNFDYRILFLPSHLQDYLIVHELCHLKEMNHSPRFWELVAQVVPAYKQCRTELRSQKRSLM
ncbi:MAG: M48 family metallopeptidase [Candidatus Pacebacteria bacterium]|nr:M48 family metallopeptidase [Candidatus Paceibacterota bacterium]